MTEEEIMREIHSVFAKQMKNDNYGVSFHILTVCRWWCKDTNTCTGFTELDMDSSTSLGGQGSIYILANVEVVTFAHVSVQLYVIF